MGCTQSNQYFFGFVNLSISHLDVLSFALGMALTLGIQYMFRYCKHTQRASKHILGSRKFPSHTLGSVPHARPNFYPYPGPTSFSNTPEGPPATAPPVPGTAVMAWPSQCSPSS